MGLRLFVVFALCILGAYQVSVASLTGGVDWPGRGSAHVMWAEHPVLFVAAVISWLVIAVVVGWVTVQGFKRVRWLVKNR